LNGKFDGDRFNWEAYYNHGHVFMTSTTNRNIDEQRLTASLDAVINPANNQVVCRVTLTNPGLYPGCVPTNVFGPTSPVALLSCDSPFAQLPFHSGRMQRNVAPLRS